MFTPWKRCWRNKSKTNARGHESTWGVARCNVETILQLLSDSGDFAKMLCYEHIYKLMVHKQRSMVRTMVARRCNALHWWVLGPVKPNFVFHIMLFKRGHPGPENFLFFRWNQNQYWKNIILCMGLSGYYLGCSILNGVLAKNMLTQ